MTQKKASQDKAATAAPKTTKTDKSKTAPVEGRRAGDINRTLINAAKKEITAKWKIISKNMLAIGDILINKFKISRTNDSNDNIVERVSYNKLIEELTTEPDMPSKTWFFNAVKLAMDAKDFVGDSAVDVKYNKLPQSSRLVLAQLNRYGKAGREKKKSILKDVVSGNLEVKNIIKEVGNFRNREFEMHSDEVLSRLSEKALEQAAADVGEQLTKLKRHIETMEKALKTAKTKRADYTVYEIKIETRLAELSASTEEQAGFADRILAMHEEMAKDKTPATKGKKAGKASA